ncbi:hypothetical protein PGT21_010932 [Puccinia graminis f. sp. tritici]|uniref:Uncharacterized protein n=1 Tax=Puccinia graminis f. sp. tritici TaxID=56615 RepID=A0A5B0NYX9_PUCGR|nr:hypothetical protein PGT21_010932 [Puccinia graminis f. sp. tritici]KAA1093774.1 hypothetical protein PGTUg99_028815 [Puccinia graminis f. sp. tritici]
MIYDNNDLNALNSNPSPYNFEGSDDMFAEPTSDVAEVLPPAYRDVAPMSVILPRSHRLATATQPPTSDPHSMAPTSPVTPMSPPTTPRMRPSAAPFMPAPVVDPPGPQTASDAMFSGSFLVAQFYNFLIMLESVLAEFPPNHPDAAIHTLLRMDAALLQDWFYHHRSHLKPAAHFLSL